LQLVSVEVLPHDHESHLLELVHLRACSTHTDMQLGWRGYQYT
jgi:hypothetical protein